MKKYKLKYWYLATGMEGIADEWPEKIVFANTRDEAFYEYHKLNIKNFVSFEEFMKKSKHEREWATTCEELPIRKYVESL
jgi:replicative superfamily II helicase